ncbi:unnamed protein product [Phytophthora fragariaefolia]|uniref:Unnamed protein product n=1 Tax=Phytophthora fragariaefolia TaxID=1490495 RepID=A0A9W6XZM7_9STRA|nr:unnamed protein product [Phytophthora fragariaefolia]
MSKSPNHIAVAPTLFDATVRKGLEAIAQKMYDVYPLFYEENMLVASRVFGQVFSAAMNTPDNVMQLYGIKRASPEDDQQVARSRGWR